MKRFTAEHVLDIAQRFAAGGWAESWTLFGPKIRAALLDSAIMDEMRIADSADSDIEFTAAQVVKLRNDLEAVLAEGVKPAHSRRLKCAYRVED